jgi:hypothetical protein
MKKIIIILGFISFIFSTNAQITLEHTFNLEKTFNISKNFGISWFETTSKGLMWFEYPDTITNQLKIYNADYSLYKVVTLPRPKGQVIFIQYMSDQLFNTNNLIEFICDYVTEYGVDRIILYDENATVIKDFGPISNITDYPTVINSNSGKTKLVITRLSSNTLISDVYSLTGAMPNNVPELKMSVIQSAYPNPSKVIVNLPYSLEKGQTSTMRIYKTNGQLIDQKQIGSAFDKIMLNVDSYQSGTYIYEYNGVSKKFIVN